jgi:hypothetical protein
LKTEKFVQIQTLDPVRTSQCPLQVLLHGFGNLTADAAVPALMSLEFVATIYLEKGD